MMRRIGELVSTNSKAASKSFHAHKITEENESDLSQRQSGASLSPYNGDDLQSDCPEKASSTTDSTTVEGEIFD